MLETSNNAGCIAEPFRLHQSSVQWRLTASTGLRVERVAIATKCHQILCEVIHRRLPASLATENHEREPERQECSQSSSMSREKNVKKLAILNTLFLEQQHPTTYPQECRIWHQSTGRPVDAVSRHWTPLTNKKTSSHSKLLVGTSMKLRGGRVWSPLVPLVKCCWCGSIKLETTWIN